MKTYCGLALALVVAVAWPARAQVNVEVQTPAPAPAAATTTAESGMRLSQLLGSTVQLQGVNNFGRVEDAMIDPGGMVTYLVVSSNGQNLVLPWSEANFNVGQRIVTYNVTPQAVRPLFFEGNAWPNVWAPAYVTRVRTIFPRAGIFRREVLRPAVPVVPPGAVVTPPPGAAAVPGAVVTPGGVIDEKVKVQPNGNLKVKERIR